MPLLETQDLGQAHTALEIAHCLLIDAADQVIKAQRIVPALGPSLPLPPGFIHSRRITSGKPEGYTQYWVECTNDACPSQGVQKADRIQKLAKFFNDHKHCR